ncbi:ATP-dependent helicase [Moraxella osloensis]|nr:ATP-dependent helicase [Moraxella osloensis]
MGMREMQSRAFAKRQSQYLLIKSPPASGKSRAMMFLALDKLINQGIKKVIVAVPEMSIGKSFKSTALSQYGFFADWEVDDRYNLCLNNYQSDNSKTEIFSEFLREIGEGAPMVLVCTHHSLRYGYDKVADVSLFNDVLLGIDEFHHVSASDNNRLGAIIDEIMTQSNAHIVAMTGSYFRGDAVPILLEKDEEKFDKVTYTYYEQLNGYNHLKSLSLNYCFYTDSFFDALPDCLDTRLKTIIHIPNVNAIAAETDKYETVRKIIGYIGETVNVDTDTGVLTVKTDDGRLLKVADLVNDDATRVKTQAYLANITERDDMDIIIALGMAKEGFDWVYCEHVLTIGYRGSMTEVIQIIGRATRDVAGKTHAQFTNLIAMPEASQTEVTNAVNDMLKAISLSLLMEQVLAPNVNFKPRSEVKPDDVLPIGTIIIEDSINPPSKRALQILNQDSNEIIAEISQNTQLAKQYIQATPEFKNGLDADEQAELISDTVLPTMLRIRYPYLDDDEIGQVQQGVMTKLLINNNGGVVDANQIPDDAEIEGERQFVEKNGKYIDIAHLSPVQRESLDPINIVKERHLPYNVTIFDPTTNQATQRTTNATNEQFVKIGKKFINVADLPINLINSVNPFQRGYEVLSKNLDSQALHTINEVVQATRSTMTEQEAFGLWERINDFIACTGNEPNRNSNDPREVRMAEALNFIRIKVAEQRNRQSNSDVQNNE